MRDVDAGVEDGDLDLGTGLRAGRHPAGGQPPRRTQKLRFHLCAGRPSGARKVFL